MERCELRDETIYVQRSIGVHDDPDDDDTTTKTETGQRLVSMFPSTRKVLEDLLRAYTEKHGDQPADDVTVFGTVERARGRDGVPRAVGRPLSLRMVARVFRRYADRAKIPEKFTLHDLRHTTVTRLIEQGADIQLIAAVAGHSNPAITLKVYAHLLPDRVSAAARLFNPAGTPEASHTASHTTSENNV